MKHIILTLGMVFCVAQGYAQNSSKQTAADAFDAFRKEITADFENFRKQCMEEYAAFVSNPWKAFEGKEPVPVPKEEPVPPVVMPEDDKNKHHDDKPVIIDEVVTPEPVKPQPQPQPIEPIEEVPMVETKFMEFTFFGTKAKVRFDDSKVVHLASVSEKNVARALNEFEPETYDNLLFDCLKLREERGLSDWAYLQMLNELSECACGKNTNDATLLMAYLYLQSGYKMRFGSHDGRLYMLYASRHYIYEKERFEIDGCNYYCLTPMPERMHISEAAFPKEKPLSLIIDKAQSFDEAMVQQRTVKSSRYPDATVSYSVNKNLMSFYNTYPTSMIGDNMMTRWAMYANTPMDNNLKQGLYPQLKSCIEGKTQAEAANILLNLVQTGFEYEYDDKIWGGDRAFFPEETLFYPYCDCEDRSILFTRLVRDLMGLNCILVYYPGHLACAVNFTEPVGGDYISFQGKRFVITDPTYINAPVGRTMSGMDNMSAKAIILQ